MSDYLVELYVSNASRNPVAVAWARLSTSEIERSTFR